MVGGGPLSLRSVALQLATRDQSEAKQTKPPHEHKERVGFGDRGGYVENNVISTNSIVIAAGAEGEIGDASGPTPGAGGSSQSSGRIRHSQDGFTISRHEIRQIKTERAGAGTGGASVESEGDRILGG